MAVRPEKPMGPSLEFDCRSPDYQRGLDGPLLNGSFVFCASGIEAISRTYPTTNSYAGPYSTQPADSGKFFGQDLQNLQALPSRTGVP